MPLYECSICNLQTSIIQHYKRHLTTYKHQRNAEKFLMPMVMNTNEHKMNINEHKRTQMNTNEHKSKNVKKIHTCDYCEAKFKTIPSKRRHQLHYCNENMDLKLEIKKLEKEKNKLRKDIEILLTKVGNTTNNIIIVNNFGKENLDYIKDDFLKQIMKGPYGAIPKLIKTIHFHPEFPENHNIKITNKKLPYASVWNKENWEIRNKKEVIDNLVDKGYDILDNNSTILDSFSKFQNNYENNSEIVKTIEKDTELMIVNESKKLD